MLKIECVAVVNVKKQKYPFFVLTLFVLTLLFLGFLAHHGFHYDAKLPDYQFTNLQEFDG